MEQMPELPGAQRRAHNSVSAESALADHGYTAAKRRKNAAQGVSPGWAAKHSSPEGAKDTGA